MQKHSQQSSWIYSPLYDSVFILSLPFVCLIVITLLPSVFNDPIISSDWVWVVLILCIDVGHVYSTIYRTYFDKEIIKSNKAFFVLSPLLIYVSGVFIYSISAEAFWRTMAYLAVFHFVRQQYGFTRLYDRYETNNFSKKLDALTIYSATIYPILYWHLDGQQEFNWFVENDFYYLDTPSLIPYLTFLYVLVLVAFFLKEIYFLIRYKTMNIPKNIFITGTLLSWYLGIVYFKGDLAFTLFNVVCHGIPYYALVWAYGNKRSSAQSFTNSDFLKKIFAPKNILFFVLILFLLAYFEELIWDGFIWKEHTHVFPTTTLLPAITFSKALMTLFVPLFSLPQLLHYFIDGFIWKMKKDKFNWYNFIK